MSILSDKNSQGKGLQELIDSYNQELMQIHNRTRQPENRSPEPPAQTRPQSSFSLDSTETQAANTADAQSVKSASSVISSGEQEQWLKDLEEGLAELHKGLIELAKGQKELNDGLKEWREGMNAAVGASAVPRRPQNMPAAGETGLSPDESAQWLSELENGLNELRQGMEELAKGQKELNDGLREWQEGVSGSKYNGVGWSTPWSAMQSPGSDSTPWSAAQNSGSDNRPSLTVNDNSVNTQVNGNFTGMMNSDGTMNSDGMMDSDGMINTTGPSQSAQSDQSSQSIQSDQSHQSTQVNHLAGLAHSMGFDRNMPMPDEKPLNPPIEDIVSDPVGYGSLCVSVQTARQALPIKGAGITVTLPVGDHEIFYDFVTTDESGKSPSIELPVYALHDPDSSVPDDEYTEYIPRYRTYRVRVQATGFRTKDDLMAEIFDGLKSSMTVELEPLAADSGDRRNMSGNSNGGEGM